MRLLKAIIAVLAIIISISSTAYAQPATPKEEIPKDIPAEVREQIEIVLDCNRALPFDALKKLHEMGAKAEAAVPILIEELNNKTNCRWWAAAALGAIGDKRAVDPLIASLNSPDRVSSGLSFSVENAVSALASIGDKRAVEPLINILSNEKEPYELHRTVSTALGTLGDKRAVEPLFNTLNYITNISVLKKSAEALDKLGWEPGNQKEEITYLIAQQKWDELIEIDEPAVEQLIDALDNWKYNGPSPISKGYSVYALGEIGDKRAVEPLIKYYTSLVVYGSFSGTDPSKILDRMKPNWRYHPEIGKAIETRLLFLKQAENRVHNIRANLRRNNSNMSTKRFNERVYREQINAEKELTRLTGENFGGDPEKWQSWWEENKEKFLENMPK
jgi:HEAT repeat protein